MSNKITNIRKTKIKAKNRLRRPKNDKKVRQTMASRMHVKKTFAKKKANAATLRQSRETVKAAHLAKDVLRLDINSKRGGLNTLKALRKELGPLKKTWTAVNEDGRELRYFSGLAFPVPSDRDGSLLGAGIDLTSRNKQRTRASNGSTSTAEFRWAKGRNPTNLKLAKIPATWAGRIGERLVAAVSASVAMGPPSVENVGTSDVRRRVADHVLQQFYAGGKHLVSLDGVFMAYNAGVWGPLGRPMLEQRILEVLTLLPQVGTVKQATFAHEVADLLFVLQAQDTDLFRRQSDPSAVINCKNCELWFSEDGDVEPRTHSPDSYLEHQLPVHYDTKAKCPQYDQALRGIFAKSGLPKVMIRHWHELVGYIIHPQRHHALVVFLFGEGNNGKTRLTQTIERLLGRDLICTGRVEELESDKFSLAQLRGKRLFVDDDVHDGIKLPDGTLKKISESKLLTSERKFENKFAFVSRVVPVLLCNNVPTLTDLSLGMLRRLQVIPFDRAFTPKTANPNLFTDIWANELPGVLNRAIEGWQRLHARKRFSPPKSVRQATHRWLTYANPLAGFLADRCRQEPKAQVLLKDLYATYCQWLKQSGITTVHSNAKVKLQLQQRGFTAQKRNQGITILGLKLRSTDLPAT